MSSAFDTRRCELGEGPLWHPLRNQLFWFDILGRRMLSRTAAGAQEWTFGERVSAAGWIDEDRLLIASETALFAYDIDRGTATTVCPLEADDRGTRSNDGRADPQGGFWIGTMGLNGSADRGRGAIYRFHRGELRRLFAGITIPNSICFSPDGTVAHFSDTDTGRVMQVALDADGWPAGEPALFLDLSRESLNPDGAVIDAQGVMWMAQWGAGRVAAYTPEGTFLSAVTFDAPHTSCPAFGGQNLTTLFCTTALEGMCEAARASRPMAGMTFAAVDVGHGQSEHRVIL